MKKKTSLYAAAALLVVALQLKAFVDDFVKMGEYQVGNKLYELFLPSTPYPYDQATIPEYYLADSTEWNLSNLFPGGIPSSLFGNTVNVDSIKLPLLFEQPQLPDNNDRVTLGRVLFYDKNLSANQQTACASCHNQSLGFADHQALSSGFMGGSTHRNAPSIADIPMTIHFRGLLWDKRQTVLENMVQLPIQDEVEMGMNFNDLALRLQSMDYYNVLFQNAYGDNQITKERIATALSDFVRVLLPTNTKLDQALENNYTNFTPQEMNGKLIFERDCWHCHTSVPLNEEFLATSLTLPTLVPLLSYPQNNGLSLVHTDGGVGSITGNPSDIGRFNSPSLKNIALSAPYMHDGSLATLNDVIEFYSEDIQPDPNSTFNSNAYYGPTLPSGFNYTDSEKTDLLAFLRTLTDSSFINNPIYSNPFTETITDGLPTFNPDLINGVSPNPVLSSAVVRFDNPNGELTHIRLFNTEGRIVTVGAATSEQYVIERQGLPAGFYIVSIEQGRQRATTKVLFQ